MNNWEKIPSVEHLLQTSRGLDLVSEFGHPWVVSEIRAVLQEFREIVKNINIVPDAEKILNQVEERLREINTLSVQPVINASGVILHTNLGRAPLSKAATMAVLNGMEGYASLEFDLAEGSRSHRSDHAEILLKKILGVESALVVNNNASAVLLILGALANKRRVIVPRSQLVEIGGGFRVPDVMRQSGAKLVEIGTTNKVHLTDYQTALQQPSAGILHVHSSNFKIIGFVSEPPLPEIVKAGHAVGVPVIDDIGSGALLDTTVFGLEHEPTVQESLAAGVDVICFSGDKLLGGPQSGIIVGKKKFLDLIKKHPLHRAIRADKTLLMALGETLLHYLKDEAVREIPVWIMISAPLDDLHQRVKGWQTALEFGDVVKSQSTVGGGSLPTETLPTWTLSISVKKPDKFAKYLRAGIPPLIGRIQENKMVFDARSVLPEQDPQIISILKKTLKEYVENEK